MRGRKKRILLDNLEYTLLALPGLLYFLIFHYLPMYGLILAFKDYRYDLGILGSKWIGFKNFNFFFRSDSLWRLIRNTVGYSLTFTILGILTAVIVALIMYEVTSKKWLKFYQTSMFLPNFMSWVLVAFIAFVFLDPQYGVSEQILAYFNFKSINWYAEPKAWPFILTIFQLWKTIGMSAIMYYAALMGIDPELYDAAKIDGADRWKQIRHISIPNLVPLMTILTILAIGHVFHGDFGLFYNVPRNIGMLYSTTDIVDTYVYRGLIQIGDIGMTTAVGLLQAVIGLVVVLFSNWIVRLRNADNSLF